jgi:hypothetical protein
MIAGLCDQLLALSAGLGTVQGLEMFASKVDEIAGQLLLPVQLARDELSELKHCLIIAGETICHLRHAATLQLQVLGVEQNSAG